MSYKLNKNSWSSSCVVEKYQLSVTLPLHKWEKYISDGKHILYGSGGIIPGGVMTTAFGNSGAVYKGKVSRRY